jgi:hypothetical protein
MRSKVRPAHKAATLTAICEPLNYKMWKPGILTSLYAFMACYRHIFKFLLLMWLSHYAANRKVAGSIPDEVNF